MMVFADEVSGYGYIFAEFDAIEFNLVFKSYWRATSSSQVQKKTRL